MLAPHDVSTKQSGPSGVSNKTTGEIPADDTTILDSLTLSPSHL